MSKNIKSKIILVSVISGLIIIGTLGFYYLNSILEIKNLISNSVQVQELLTKVEIMQKNAKFMVSMAIIVFLIVAIIISRYLKKFVICPKNKFIKSDEKSELKDKLSEVSTRKNQIETILLHMTDGIIAFNMQGEIILINPVAKKFLSISPEDNTFDDIFKKFNLDINSMNAIKMFF